MYYVDPMEKILGREPDYTDYGANSYSYRWDVSQYWECRVYGTENYDGSLEFELSIKRPRIGKVNSKNILWRAP